jgi:hypothetical protein
MNDDFDPVVEAVLRQASAAVEPEPARLARGLRAVQQQVSLGGAAAPMLGALRMPLAFMTCSIFSAAIGFVFGMQYERPSPRETTPVVVPAALEESEITPPIPVPGVMVPAEPASAKAAPEANAPVVVEAPRARPSKARAASPGQTLGFREVLSYVRRAERAERRGDPALALALLAELDERADASTLREERAVTRVLALCAQGERAAAERAQRELGAVKESIYANRMAQSCVSETKAP